MSEVAVGSRVKLIGRVLKVLTYPGSGTSSCRYLFTNTDHQVLLRPEGPLPVHFKDEVAIRIDEYYLRA